MQQLTDFVTFLISKKLHCSLGVMITVIYVLGPWFEPCMRVLHLFLFFREFYPNFKCKLPAFANFRDRGLFILWNRHYKVALGPGLTHEFVQVLYKSSLWKLLFYYAKMAKNCSEVRIPHFPGQFWPFKTFFKSLNF